MRPPVRVTIALTVITADVADALAIAAWVEEGRRRSEIANHVKLTPVAAAVVRLTALRPPR